MALVLFSTLFLCSCLPEATHPLSGEKQATPDVRLEGDWVSTGSSSNESPVYVHFLQIDDHLMDVVYVEHNQSFKKGPTLWEAFPTKIGKLQVLNLRIAKGSPAQDIHPGHYLLMRYELTDPSTLKMWGPDDDAVGKAIRSGQLGGTIKKSGKESSFSDDSILITASPEKLRAYLETHPAGDFFSSQPMVFKRIKVRQ